MEKIKKLASVLDKHREVSIQECIYRILGLPMTKFSTKVKYLNTSHPNKRDGLLRRDLENLAEDDPVFYPSAHQYYECRPQSGKYGIDWDEMCLAEWWSSYEHSPSGKPDDKNYEMQNKMGTCRRRHEDAVLRYYLPLDDSEELARALCILFLPFRNEMSDIHKKDLEKLLAENQEKINKNREKFESNNLVVDMIKRIEEDMEKRKTLESDSEEEDEDEETTPMSLILEEQEKYDKQQAMMNMPKDDTNDNFLDPVELRKQITMLNQQQRRIFDDVIERVIDNDLEEKPFYLYIGGEAGTGKSFLLQKIIYAIRQIKVKSGQELDKPTVLVMAPTANAAYIIKGKTIESALHINMDRRNSFQKGSKERTSLLAFQYEDLAVVICDEISMLGTNKFTAVNFRLQELAQGSKKKEFMGQKSFIAAGDFRQLPPVLDKMIFEKSYLDGRPSVAPCHWNENFKIYYLTEKMRCPEDIEFAELCDRVGKGNITKEDEDFLRSRIKPNPSEDINENFCNGKMAIIVTTNEKREEINLEKLRSLLPNRKEYVCLAKDSVTNRKNHVPLPDTVSYSKTHGMMTNLIIREGAPVMITVNHKKPQYKEDGIVNGAKGWVDFIQTSESNPEKVEIIWVVFKNEDIGRKYYRRANMHLRPKGYRDFLHERALPILPTAKPFEVDQGNLHYMRSQFPLTLAYAITSHKCQGDTTEDITVDFGGKPNKKAFVDKGSFYVAITRVKSGDALYLRSFDPSYIKVNPRVEYEINTMRKVRQYEMKKIYLDEKIFIGEEIKVGYLNINGLMEGFHAEYINGDYNLLDHDILALSETHLTKNDSDEALEDVLSNWEILHRFDSPDGKKHMGLLLLTPSDKGIKPHIESNFTKEKNGQSQIQGIACSVGENSFCFIYCRSTPIQSEALYIEEETHGYDYLLGDLNLDQNDQDEQNKVVTICGREKNILLNEVTTKNGKQLDHILGKKKENENIFTTAFYNFTSDHRTISIRIGNQFIESKKFKSADVAKETENSKRVRKRKAKTDGQNIPKKKAKRSRK